MPLLEQPFVQGVLAGFALGCGAVVLVLLIVNRLAKGPIYEMDPINDDELMGRTRP